ncbi:hypothetical protein MSIMFI_05217 [Mycobacterium simulans]|nr:hypothetical protein MSIMFI_05217 [Mycobacterium simulans]
MVVDLALRVGEELTIVASASGAKVICLQSHPAWAAAQRRERQLQEEMRRHPAYLGRQRAAAMGGDVAIGVRNFAVCPGTDTPA